MKTILQFKRAPKSDTTHMSLLDAHLSALSRLARVCPRYTHQRLLVIETRVIKDTRRVFGPRAVHRDLTKRDQCPYQSPMDNALDFPHATAGTPAFRLRLTPRGIFHDAASIPSCRTTLSPIEPMSTLQILLTDQSYIPQSPVCSTTTSSSISTDSE